VFLNNYKQVLPKKKYTLTLAYCKEDKYYMELAFLNIGTQEMLIIVVVILMLFGGKKLPELARGLGRGIREFKDASEGIKKEIADQINNFEKDLDVTAEDKKYDSPTPDDAYSEVSEGEDGTGAEDAVADIDADEPEKSLPQFTTPENTYQHDPGAHPVDDTEYYKYGYNDHFASDQPADEPAAEESVENTGAAGNKPSEQA